MGIHNSLIIGLVVAIPAPVILSVIVAVIFAYRYYKESQTAEPRYRRLPTSDVEVTVNQDYTPHWLSTQYDPHHSSGSHSSAQKAADPPAIKNFII